MKRIISFISLALVLCLLLCSCGAKGDGKDTEETTDKVTDAETEAPETEDKETEAGSEEKEPEKEPEEEGMPEAYEEILTALAGAFPWSYDDVFLVPNHEEMSYIYVQYPEMDGIGYALYDIDKNGTRELIIAAIDTGFIADVYTMKDGKAVHLFAGHQRNIFTITDNGMIRNFWTGSNVTVGFDYYQLTDGEMVLFQRVTLDAYHALDMGHIASAEEATGENSWFISETADYNDYVYVTKGYAESVIEESDAKLGAPLALTLTPLSEIQK